MVAVNIGVQNGAHSLATSEEQTMYCRAPRAHVHTPPRSKSTTLTQAALFLATRVARARVSPPFDQSTARAERSKGRAGCAAARQNVRTEWLRKHRIITTPDLEECRRVSRYSELSRDLVSLVYSSLLPAIRLFRYTLVFGAPPIFFSLHACDISRQRGPQSSHVADPSADVIVVRCRRYRKDSISWQFRTRLLFAWRLARRRSILCLCYTLASETWIK